jgi:serine/threonine-protein kinase
MGDVYLAYDPRLDRRVAIKLLPTRLAADAVARERLRREALAAAALDHPFICKIFEIGEDQGTLFIVMEYISGETLYARLRAGPLPWSEALRIAAEVAEALETAHAKPLVYRDLKPANVMLTPQGRVKVMDFGLAKKPASNELKDAGATAGDLPLTAAGAVIGTPEYMSPEQVKGAPLDHRSDLFSFGIILCELLTGKHPFQRNSKLETMTAILRDQPDLAAASNAGLLPGQMVLIRRLLAKSPDERYQSIREVREDLARLASSSAATTDATGHPQRVAARRWVLALAAAVIVTAAVVGYLLTRPLPAPKVSNYVQLTHDGQPSNWWARTVRGFTSALGNTLFGALPRYPSRVASRCRFKHLPGRCTLSASLRMDPNFSSRTSKLQLSQDHYGVFPCSVARRAAWETP